MRHDFQKDIDAIARIDAVPTILNVICESTGMRFAAVARVTEDRWVTCSALDTIGFGLKPGDELKVETTICHEIRQDRQAVIIDHVAEDTGYRAHATPALYGFQSYISVPIVRRNGDFFGTLCAIDPLPAKLDNPATTGMFKMFAELIAAHLDVHDELAEARNALDAERELSDFREQFIAVLGHDLRNPVASIDAGTKALMRRSLDDKSRQIVGLMQGSVVRMRGLIDNVLDFARARLGDGLDIEFDEGRDLASTLNQVVDELRSVDANKDIETDFQLTRPVPCDHGRIAQMVSNLIGNALTHGAENVPVKVGARTTDGQFELWVENAGTPIPGDAMEHLFRPFFRGEVRASQQGLGLGLYIAQEIARVHRGRLEANSDDAATRFTFRMPLDAPAAG